MKYPIAFPILGKEERKNLLDCFDSGWISSRGDYIPRFENSFAKFCQTKYAVSVPNGTLALKLALMVLGLKAGDEVIIPNLTFGATANACLLLGIRPILVDVDLKTWNIEPSEIEKNITKRTKAIIAVHLYGISADMPAIVRIAKKYKLKIIEDAAEAHGAEIAGKKVGSWSDIGCFSFYGNKIITTGEGGMCVTNSKKLFDKMTILKNHGMAPKKKYWHNVVGSNFRLTNMQAAIGLAQMKKIDRFIAKKIKIAAWYKEEIKKQNVSVYFQKESAGAKNVWWMFTAAFAKKTNLKKLAAALAKDGIETRPILTPLSLMPAFRKLRKSKDLKISESLVSRGITLPSNLNLSRKDISFIVSKLKEKIDG